MSDSSDIGIGRPELNISPIFFNDEDLTTTRSELMQINTSSDFVFASSGLGSMSSSNEMDAQPPPVLTPIRFNDVDVNTPKGVISIPSWNSREPKDDSKREHMDCHSVDTTSALVLPSKTALKVKVNKLKITAKWKWIDGGDDRCGICRAPFEGCCIDCRMPGDDCPLVVGACKHPFHIHCIVKWTNTQQKAACPLCRQEWKFQSAE